MKKKLKEIILKLLPLKNRIVFESNPEFSCNALPVYEEMVRRGIRDKYEVYWLVEDKNKYNDDTSGNKYLNYIETGLGKIKKKYILATSKALIFTNRIQEKRKEQQLVINLMHGSPLKKTIGYVEHDTCDYVLTLSAFFNQVVSEQLDVPIYKIKSFGFPRNDVFKGRYNVLKTLGKNENSKLVVWMPTFRKNKNSNVVYGNLYKLGVPLLCSSGDFESLNDYLSEKNIVLIIKLHPVEDTSGMQLDSYSSIVFISDDKLVSKGLTAYKLLADSSALITDYSSVYYDYLLMNKPIGLVIDDLQEYSNRNGFWYGDYSEFITGEYIYTFEGLLDFIKMISTGDDFSYKQRQDSIKQFIEYNDYNATTRVVDFIMNNL